MKTNRRSKAVLLALVGLALACSSTRMHAQQTTAYTNTFATGGNTSAFAGTGSVASWIYWYGLGYNNTPITNDVTMDSANDTNSGSLQVYLPFGGSGDQAVFFGTFDNQYGYDNSVTANGAIFTNITVDVHVAPGTPLSGSGDFGVLQMGLHPSGNQDGGHFYPGSPTIPASATNGWAHLTNVVDLTDPNIASVSGFDVKYTSYSGYPTGPITFWLDNFKANLRPGPPPPPPTLTNPQAALSGLNLNSVLSSGLNHRYSIASRVPGGFTFYGQPSVTYSWNINSFPIGASAGHQQHIFIIPGTPGTESAPDYNEATVIFITVQATTNGSGYCQFRYKTNEPPDINNAHGNDMYFNSLDPTNATNSNHWPVQPVGEVDSASVLGTWSVTFSQSTNVLLTGPDGATNAFVLDPATAALFSGSCTVYVGAQENNANGYGQDVVIGNFSITGNASPVSDNFTTDLALDTNTWRVAAANNDGVVLAPPGSAYWINWTLPDPGYGLQGAPVLAGSNTAWQAMNPLATIINAGHRSALVTAASLPSSRHTFFRLVQHTFTQLQILLPGETAAPGTLTGKTGTPTPISLGAGGLCTLTVNAVDANWFPITSVTDQVSFTSTDTSAFVPLPGPLVNGTAQFNTMQFTDQGNWTVTVSDVTDPTKTSNTSSTVSITP